MPESINVLLLVEDDDNDVIITKRKIDRSNTKINELLITRSLGETKTLLNNRHDIDVILLDLNLPDSKGLDTVDSVRSLYDGIMIVLTSIDDEAVGIQAIRQGADEYLVKNQLSERILSDSITHAIERKNRWTHMHNFHAAVQKLENMLP